MLIQNKNSDLICSHSFNHRPLISICSYCSHKQYKYHHFINTKLYSVIHQWYIYDVGCCPVFMVSWSQINVSCRLHSRVHFVQLKPAVFCWNLCGMKWEHCLCVFHPETHEFHLFSVCLLTLDSLSMCMLCYACVCEWSIGGFPILHYVRVNK